RTVSQCSQTDRTWLQRRIGGSGSGEARLLFHQAAMNRWAQRDGWPLHADTTRLPVPPLLLHISLNGLLGVFLGVFMTRNAADRNVGKRSLEIILRKGEIRYKQV